MTAEPARDPAELSRNSPVQMQQVIDGLLAGRSVTQIAETLGIPRGRILRWYREDERFAELLADTEAAVITTLRAETVAAAAESVESLTGQAVEVLGEMLTAEKESVRLGAANSVLRLAGIGGRTRERGKTVEEMLRGAGGASPTTGD